MYINFFNKKKEHGHYLYVVSMLNHIRMVGLRQVQLQTVGHNLC